MKHRGVGYLDDQDICYCFCHSDSEDLLAVKDKWYRVVCIMKIDRLNDHKNTYFVPNSKLDYFLRTNPEQVIDIESITIEQINYIIKEHSNL
jgi:hypothetical protein